MLSLTALKYNEAISVSNIARYLTLLPFLAMAAVCLLSGLVTTNFIIAGLCILGGAISFFTPSQSSFRLFFDDNGQVIIESKNKVSEGVMVKGSQVWPFLIIIKTQLSAGGTTRFWIYSDSISDRGFRRLARVLLLNQFAT
ncbi:hypothetical protein Q4519_18420 [Motilimonas sp. 1_MG-2023]|uniref:protein YgfX n=1 Tax=Motilimonas sp. 1_MG-2023 TaxID=3062672 RepID=UPI0026E170F5|nr:protein YgfX [Motilimonas sp. 1_MG-2023]MDO6527653.1 hypothetical protein [Motilimonas sp. 1_MG-2023]